MFCHPKGQYLSLSREAREGSADARNECERMVLIELQAHESQRNNTDIRQLSYCMAVIKTTLVLVGY